MINKKILNKMKVLSQKIDNSVLRVSKAGVPHIVVNHKYSIGYFYRRNIFKIWDNYATAENTKIKNFNTEEEVINFFKEMEI